MYVAVSSFCIGITLESGKLKRFSFQAQQQSMGILHVMKLNNIDFLIEHDEEPFDFLSHPDGFLSCKLLIAL